MDHISQGESRAPTPSEESPDTGEGEAPAPGEAVSVGLGVDVDDGLELADGLGVGLGDVVGRGEPILVATAAGRLTRRTAVPPPSLLTRTTPVGLTAIPSP